jgi:large subunit ribosomal protein L18
MYIPMNRAAERRRIHRRIREKVAGKPNRPRLAVFRSLKHTYVQIIDDAVGKTLVAASTAEKSVRGEMKQGGNISASKIVGKVIAERAIAKGIDTVVFDRGGYLYHGRIKAVAEAARESGLKF